MKNRIFYTLSLITLLAAAVLMGYLYYLAFWPFNVVDINKVSQVLTPKVRVGEYVHIKTHYCKYMDIAASVHSAYVNGIVISLPEQTSNVPLGCHDIERKFYIQPEILPGTYRLNRDFFYKINFFQNQVVHSTTEPFEVIE